MTAECTINKTAVQEEEDLWFYDRYALRGFKSTACNMEVSRKNENNTNTNDKYVPTGNKMEGIVLLKVSMSQHINHFDREGGSLSRMYK